MTYKTHSVTLALFVALLSTFSIRAEEDLVAMSKSALTAFKAKDSSLTNFMNRCVGFAVFPDIGKGGFIVGGAHGKGIVYEKGGGVIGKSTMSQASVGAQAGGQSFSELIFFETPTALNNFKNGKFEMSGEISAVAIQEGASAAAARSGAEVVTRNPSNQPRCDFMR